MASFKFAKASKKASAVSLALALSTVGGCSRWCTPEIIRVPVEVERVRIVVEPIPAELLRQHPVATGDLAHCPQVAAQRRAELDACNDDKRALRSRAAEKGELRGDQSRAARPTGASGPNLNAVQEPEQPERPGTLSWQWQPRGSATAVLDSFSAP